MPVDWCSLGGAERCSLRHWLRAGDGDGQGGQREYCVVCDGTCLLERHGRLDRFCRQLQTLTRDTRRFLEDGAEFEKAIWAVMESRGVLGEAAWVSRADLGKQSGCAASSRCGGQPWRAYPEFPAGLLRVWRAGKGAVPRRGEVWRIARESGLSELFAVDK